ncbi:MAG TPA: ABC transporter substrate-binding protein [Bradyrhizobium sp.]|nr:ABC transporter substrate-binding protein [Bradyrhizobium sp.]
MAGAQEAGKLARIGFLGSGSAAGSTRSVDALRKGLAERGHREGQNISIEFRWAEGDYNRLAGLAAELVGLKVDVLVTHGTPGTLAARQATSSIPVVMAISGDAPLTGLVTNLARPEANVTGSTYFLSELNAKRLQWLHDIFPAFTRIAALSNPGNPISGPIMTAMETMAANLKISVEQFKVGAASEFETAFTAMGPGRIDAVVVTEDGEFAASHRMISELAAANRLVSIGATEFASAGGLIGYGANILELYRRAGYFVDRIIKGARPADLPVERPATFELVINLKTARMIGSAIPPSVLLLANDVIE